jgi:hypothetical protein
MQHVWSLRREIDFSAWLLPPAIESTAESYAFSRWASGRLRRVRPNGFRWYRLLLITVYARRNYWW